MRTSLDYRWGGESTGYPILVSRELLGPEPRQQPAEAHEAQIMFQGSFTSTLVIRPQTIDASYDFDLLSTQAIPNFTVALAEFTDLFSSFLQDAALPETRTISDFADEPYEVVKRIDVRFRRRDPGIEAHFREANIAWVDDSWDEAYNGLKAEILDTFDGYEENESILGPEPKRQLAVLRRHIRRSTAA